MSKCRHELIVASAIIDAGRFLKAENQTPETGCRREGKYFLRALSADVSRPRMQKRPSGRNQTGRVAITRIGGASDLFGSSAVLAHGVARMTPAYEGGNVVELKEIKTRKQANEATRQIRASCGHEQK
jgi:hypothetical protein